VVIALYITGILRRKLTDAKKTEAEKAEEADAQILAAIASRKKLASDRELAKGIEYTEALRTSWVASVTTCDHNMLSLFIGGYPHGIFARGVKRRIRRFARAIILLSMVTTSLHRLTHSKYVHRTFTRQRLTVLLGYEDTPTAIEVPQVKEDYDSDSHSTPGYTRGVRFRSFFFMRTVSLTRIQVFR
jgi:hypothetical protein